MGIFAGRKSSWGGYDSLFSQTLLKAIETKPDVPEKISIIVETLKKAKVELDDPRVVKALAEIGIEVIVTRGFGGKAIDQRLMEKEDPTNLF